MALTAIYGPVWPHMAPFVPLWSRLALYGPVWYCMDWFGQVWCRKPRIILDGPVRPCITPFDTIGLCMFFYGLEWPHIVKYGPLWPHMVQYGHEWSHIVQ